VRMATFLRSARRRVEASSATLEQLHVLRYSTGSASVRPGPVARGRHPGAPAEGGRGGAGGARSAGGGLRRDAWRQHPQIILWRTEVAHPAGGRWPNPRAPGRRGRRPPDGDGLPPPGQQGRAIVEVAPVIQPEAGPGAEAVGLAPTAPPPSSSGDNGGLPTGSPGPRRQRREHRLPGRQVVGRRYSAVFGSRTRPTSTRRRRPHPRAVTVRPRR